MQQTIDGQIDRAAAKKAAGPSSSSTPSVTATLDGTWTRYTSQAQPAPPPPSLPQKSATGGLTYAKSSVLSYFAPSTPVAPPALKKDQESQGLTSNFAPLLSEQHNLLPTSTLCCICQSEFAEGIIIAVTDCNHTVHGHCLVRWILANQPTSCVCPICRKALSVKGLTYYRSLTSKGAPISEMVILTSTNAEVGAASEYSSRSGVTDSHLLSSPSAYTADEHVDDEAMLVWWPVPVGASSDGVTESVFHLGTRLEGGRAGLLIDTGAWGNLSGDAWVKEQGRLSKSAGYMPAQAKMDTPLKIQGVGSGTQQCSWKSELPIALPR
eukprot:7299642-Prorocentrum_lima.AAC.1